MAHGAVDGPHHGAPDAGRFQLDLARRRHLHRQGLLAQQGGGEWQDNWLATCLVGMARAVALTGEAFSSEDPPEESFVAEIVQGALFAWEENPERFSQLEEAVLLAQREDLIPWLLGHEDPLRKRAEGA